MCTELDTKNYRLSRDIHTIWFSYTKMNWADALGIKRTSDLVTQFSKRVGNDPPLRGLFTGSRVAKGQSIALIPSSAILSAHNLSALLPAPVVRCALQPTYTFLSRGAILSLCGLLLDQSNELSGWIAALPSRAPPYLSLIRQHLDRQPNPQTWEKVEQIERVIEADLIKFAEAMTTFKRLDEAQVRRAWFLYRTRAVAVKPSQKGPALVPLVDMLNHSLKNVNVDIVEGQGCVEMIALEAIEKGEELLLNYGHYNQRQRFMVQIEAVDPEIAPLGVVDSEVNWIWNFGFARSEEEQQYVASRKWHDRADRRVRNMIDRRRRGMRGEFVVGVPEGLQLLKERRARVENEYQGRVFPKN